MQSLLHALLRGEATIIVGSSVHVAAMVFSCEELH